MLSQMFRAAQSSLSAALISEARLALEAAEIPSFSRSLHELKSELRRCRRYEHALSLMAVQIESSSLQRAVHANGDEGAEADALHLRRLECTALLLLGWVLRDATRECDRLSYSAEHDVFVVVMPETDTDAARLAAERLSALFGRRSGLTLRIGAATFPDDELTVEDLFEQARGACTPWTAISVAAAPPPLTSAGGSAGPTSAATVVSDKSEAPPAPIERARAARREGRVQRVSNG
jgi:hypothetical protein